MRNDKNTHTQINIAATVITKQQLNSVGINLPDEEMQALIQHAEETINKQITEEVIGFLDDSQIHELTELQDSGASMEQVDTWIREKVPYYEQIIEDNVTIVVGELVSNSEAIQSK